jgi:outer membrane protein OmpA-like peptidoglycan-associated protein
MHDQGPKPPRRPHQHGMPATVLALQRNAGNAAVVGLLGASGRLSVQRCGPVPCDCPPEKKAAYAAEEAERDPPATPVQRVPTLVVQRACGSRAIGTVASCVGLSGDLPAGSRPFLFTVNCDTLAAGEEARLRAFAATVPGRRVALHGFASVEGKPIYNQNLSCARAERSALILSGAGVAVATLHSHGATPGLQVPRRSVVVEVLPPVCGTPPPCPVGPGFGPGAAPLPRNPGIPSGAQCRGACGPDCPPSCVPQAPVTRTVTDPAGCRYLCTYDNVIDCGSHQGCRDHDDCYDRCAATSGETELCHHGGECHCACDIACLGTHGIGNCNRWRQLYSDPPIRSLIPSSPGAP